MPNTQKLNAEIIRIGSQQFPLLPLDKTQKRLATDEKTNIYDRYISLDTDGLLPLLPIRLYTGATQASASTAISPYTDNAEKDIDYAAAPLCLDASIHGAVLRKMKLTQQKPTLPDPLLPEVKEKLSRLCFHVLLPRKDTLAAKQPIYDIFVSKPDETALALGELSFRQFTPQEKTKHTAPAYFLMLPSEEKILGKLQGQFIVMP